MAHGVGDDPGHGLDGIEAEIGARRMAGSSDHLEPRGHLPFVRQHRLHPARLADNRTERLLAQARQRSQEMRHAAASRLFVIGEREMKRLLQFLAASPGSAANAQARKPFMSVVPRP